MRKITLTFFSILLIGVSIAQNPSYTAKQGNLQFKTNRLDIILSNKETKIDTLKIYNSGNKKIELKYDKFPDYVTILNSMSKLDAGEEGFVIIKYDASKRNGLGSFLDEVYIFTDDIVLPKKIFFIRAMIKEDFSELTTLQLANAPIIIIDNETCDFGQVKEGKVVDCFFVLKNIGKTVLKIHKVKASSYSTSVILEKNEIEPGQSSVIKCSFNTTDIAVGTHIKKISVISNDPKRSNIDLKMKGVVILDDNNKWVSVSDPNRKFNISKSQNDLTLSDVINNKSYLLKIDNPYIKNVYTRANMTIPSGKNYCYSIQEKSGSCAKMTYECLIRINENKYKWDHFVNISPPDNYTTCFSSSTYSDYGTIVKDLSEELKLVPEKFASNNLLFRSTKEFGKIATDYVPPIYSTYNAGRKYTFEGASGEDVTIQEKDYRSYVKDGDYNSEIQGYKYIFQIINKSQKNYLVYYKLTGTSKMTDIVKNTSWFSLNNYKTNYDYNDFVFENSFIIKPDSTYKENVIVGVDFPANLTFENIKIDELSNEWIIGLNKAIIGKDTDVIVKYLNDPLAKSWKSIIQQNLDNFRLTSNKDYFEKTKSFVNAKIIIVDPITFDVSFDSDVKVVIQNKSLDYVSVTYKTPFGSYTEIINPNSVYEKVHTIKGIEKSNLKVEITSLIKR